MLSIRRTDICLHVCTIALILPPDGYMYVLACLQDTPVSDACYALFPSS